MGDFEDMLMRILAKRDLVATKPYDPGRLRKILEEWSIMIGIIDQGYEHLWEDLP